MRYLNYLLLVGVFASLQGCLPVIAAGVGTGAFMANDRRTTGSYIEDESIEDKAFHLINKKYKNTAHVNFTSFNRRVLITGEVPNEEVKADINNIATSIINVKEINNELTVAGNTSFTSRSSDGIVTANVKLRFVNNKVFSADHVKVITESGTVYLMGLVYHNEAATAADIASTTKGVQRVVMVFDYLD